MRLISRYFIFVSLLTVGIFILIDQVKGDEADCTSDMECLKVYGKRITCDEDAMCSDGFPQTLSIDCYKMLVHFDNPELTGRFGEPRGDRTHNGIDLAVPTGTPVHAAKDGIVNRTEKRFKEGDRSTPNGNYVRITYDDGTEGVFIHLLKVDVEEHQRVNAGEKIGTSDDTGRSKGPHLHYTQYDTSGKPMDPVKVHARC